MPDLSDLVPFHSGQVRNFCLLVPGRVKIDLLFCIPVTYYELTHVENNNDPDQLASPTLSRSQLIWIYTVFNSLCLVLSCF